jgi:hypothetical protein
MQGAKRSGAGPQLHQRLWSAPHPTASPLEAQKTLNRTYGLDCGVQNAKRPGVAAGATPQPAGASITVIINLDGL